MNLSATLLSFSQRRALLLGFCLGVAHLHGADPKIEAVIKRTPDVLVSAGCGECEATELWLLDRSTGQLEFLLRGKDDSDITKTIAEISEPTFSLDKKFLYFVSAAWATSGSIQRVDLNSKQVRFVIDGNSVEVIPSGSNQGMLLIERALIKFDQNGVSLGRSDYLWLVSTDGMTRSEIGPSDSFAVAEFRKKYVLH